ncbi:MAG: AzlD domain-containing protein [archaeon]|nr:AzlD domain-containing protein [archaeon]
MELVEGLAVIAICGIVTLFTRAFPFMVFKDGDRLRPGISYLGYALPAALFAMLVVYCLKDVDFMDGVYGIPEVVSILFTAALHVKWRNMILSIVGGTAFYICLNYILTLL